MDRKQNVLKDALTLYPELWKEAQRFKAVMLDFMPQDKMIRNLLYICLDEKIPDELVRKSNISNQEIAKYCKRLMNACGCSNEVAIEVIDMWLYAFDIECPYNILDKTIEEICFEGLLEMRIINCLARYGIFTLGDLVNHTEEEIRLIRNLGRKSFEHIVNYLNSVGLRLKANEVNQKENP